MNDLTQSCPACAAPEREFVEAVRGFEIVRCTACRLEYTTNPTVDLSDYARTYGGEEGMLVNPKPYASPAARLALECDALFRPPPPLTVTERWVLRQIVSQVPQGSTILDLGCGTGRFLRALRRRSYQAIGIDPAEPVVLRLRRLGCDAHIGSMPGLHWDGPRPAAITMFEVLEHLVHPLAVLEELRARFPAACVGASVPSPFRAGLRQGRGQTDYPPNHFLRWTPSALERAFARAGYRKIQVAVPAPSGSELLAGAGNLLPLPMLRRLAGSERRRPVGRDGPAPNGGSPPLRRRVLATTLLMAHRAFGLLTDVAGMPKAHLAARRGWSSASMAVWAEP
jgi:hypothetical protein